MPVASCSEHGSLVCSHVIYRAAGYAPKRQRADITVAVSEVRMPLGSLRETGRIRMSRGVTTAAVGRDRKRSVSDTTQSGGRQLARVLCGGAGRGGMARTWTSKGSIVPSWRMM